MTRATCNNKAHAGFTLVELLVGVVIGLIGIMVIFQVFSVTESTKRTTTGGGDAQQSGSLALFTVERDVRMSGYGMNDIANLGCTLRFYDEGTSPARTILDLRLVPIEIRQPADQVPAGVAEGPDQVIVTYGSSDLLATPTKFEQPSTSSATYHVENRFGFREGDFIIATEPGKPCTAAQVSNLPNNPGQKDNVIHASGTYTDPVTGNQVAARYNKPGGINPAVSYSRDAMLISLGSAPQRNIYSISNARLTMQNEFMDVVPAPMLDNIVQLQAQYGKDMSGDGIVDLWDTVTPANGSPDWQRIIAVRIAIVARSSTPEKRDPATGLCSATTAYPTWGGGDINLKVTVPTGAPSDDWQCFRYRVFTTAVPLRNMIWRQE
ncbi:MAG TPA: PilW family protein [Burkholderiales bacterium]|nr:PilW family protein [Burkholderiales bacterium]